MTRKLILFFAALMTFIFSTASTEIDKPREAMIDIHVIEAVARSWARDHDGSPLASADSLVPVSALERVMTPPFMSRIPKLDAWGNPYLYWSDGREYLILSTGGDGKKDKEYDLHPDHWRGIPAGADASTPGADIVLSNEGFLQWPHAAQDRSATMAEMRSIATAVEAYSIDHRAYPGPTTGVAGIDTIKDALAPSYIRDLYIADAWGHPYQYWSDGQSYLIFSTGADGKPDHDFSGLKTPLAQLGRGGATATSGADLILVDGNFRQWPAGTR